MERAAASPGEVAEDFSTEFTDELGTDIFVKSIEAAGRDQRFTRRVSRADVTRW